MNVRRLCVVALLAFALVDSSLGSVAHAVDVGSKSSGIDRLALPVRGKYDNDKSFLTATKLAHTVGQVTELVKHVLAGDEHPHAVAQLLQHALPSAHDHDLTNLLSLHEQAFATLGNATRMANDTMAQLVSGECTGSHCANKMLSEKTALYWLAVVGGWVALLIAMLLTSFRVTGTPLGYLKLLATGIGLGSFLGIKAEHGQSTKQAAEKAKEAGDDDVVEGEVSSAKGKSFESPDYENEEFDPTQPRDRAMDAPETVSDEPDRDLERSVQSLAQKSAKRRNAKHTSLQMEESNEDDTPGPTRKAYLADKPRQNLMAGIRKAGGNPTTTKEINDGGDDDAASTGDDATSTGDDAVASEDGDTVGETRKAFLANKPRQNLMADIQKAKGEPKATKEINTDREGEDGKKSKKNIVRRGWNKVFEWFRTNDNKFKMNVMSGIVGSTMAAVKWLQESNGMNPADSQLAFSQILGNVFGFTADLAVTGRMYPSTFNVSFIAMSLMYFTIVWVDTAISVNLVLWMVNWRTEAGDQVTPSWRMVLALAIGFITQQLYVNIFREFWIYRIKLWGPASLDKVKSVLIFGFAAVLVFHYVFVVTRFNEAIVRDMCVRTWDSYAAKNMTYCAVYTHEELSTTILMCQDFCKSSSVSDEAICQELALGDAGGCGSGNKVERNGLYDLITVILLGILFVFVFGALFGLRKWTFASLAYEFSHEAQAKVAARNSKQQEGEAAIQTDDSPKTHGSPEAKSNDNTEDQGDLEVVDASTVDHAGSGKHTPAAHTAKMQAKQERGSAIEKVRSALHPSGSRTPKKHR